MPELLLVLSHTWPLCMCTLLQGSSSSTVCAYSYSVKVVNANKKADYKVHKLRNTSKVLASVIQLKARLMESLEEHMPSILVSALDKLSQVTKGLGESSTGFLFWRFGGHLWNLQFSTQVWNNGLVWCRSNKMNRKKQPSPTSDDDSAPREEFLQWFN